MAVTLAGHEKRRHQLKKWPIRQSVNSAGSLAIGNGVINGGNGVSAAQYESVENNLAAMAAMASAGAASINISGESNGVANLLMA